MIFYRELNTSFYSCFLSLHCRWISSPNCFQLISHSNLNFWNIVEYLRNVAILYPPLHLLISCFRNWNCSWKVKIRYYRTLSHYNGWLITAEDDYKREVLMAMQRSKTRIERILIVKNHILNKKDLKYFLKCFLFFV